MFTKYNGITLPQNYSGNRFKAHPNDTETKTHRPTESIPLATGVRTSVSPSFCEATEESISQDLPEKNDGIPNEDEELDVSLDCENEETIHTPPSESSSNPFREISKIINKSGLGNLFGSLRSDDILLLALILILAEDGDTQSPDAILILALLLFLH